MNQTLPTADLNTAGTTDVIPSVAIDRIIAQRNEGIALFMQAMECLATARRILLDASGDIFLYGFEDCVTDSVRRMDKPEEAKRNITRLADRKIWDRLMTDTGMYTFMSSCQRDEWNSQLMSDTCPEITLDNVLATFRHLNTSKMQTFGLMSTGNCHGITEPIIPAVWARESLLKTCCTAGVTGV